MTGPEALRNLPSVSHLLETDEVRSLLARHPRAVVVGAIRRILERLREEATGGGGAAHRRAEWSSLLLARLPGEIRSGEEIPLRRLINATGVVIHTNLGRAPLPEEAVRALAEVAARYSNLEYDLETGARFRRLAHVEEMLLELTGAESVHVVNNNAAAVLLCLAGVARGREVIVSRGELVEIGGSFRIPDILAESGATLVEVGTTNRTRLSDYERAAGPRTAMLLKVHRSNFRMSGFTEEVTASELAVLGDRIGIPVMEDLGSGALFDFQAAGIPGTPTVRQALRQGPGIVTVSGDKLLGGPQAGIIAGRSALVDPLKRHPLSRALRMDKLCLAALAATLRLYADERRAAARIPVLRMMLEEEKDIRARARRLVRRVNREAARAVPEGSGSGVTLSLERGTSYPGGGAMPEVGIPTICIAVSLAAVSPGELDARLRKGNPPVVGRIGNGRFLLDMRTVRDAEVKELSAALAALRE
ncbi:MAG TPA: L-seryl-tRNA(Sec) selenium transferase [Deltaproteobacteria bacterium]|nr:MAG: L-seryl-tRNA(Sec) selenium transferase [Deltaproteobacteria bacterium GWC2_65_14]HBO70224.1 L-seryl-tRNA(Sec) selenium transferase [Deltaproteobacteria bacterium]